MSVDNLTMLHTAAFTPFHTLAERPRLGMMLPEPTQRQATGSPQQAVSPASSTTSQGFYDHRPQVQHTQSFSLPPIRELLKDTPAPVVPVAVRASSASDASTMPMPSPMAQPMPSSRPLPSLHQIPSPQYQPYHSITPPPQTQSQGPLGRSSSLPNYLAHYDDRVPSPSLSYPPQHQAPTSQYPTSHPIQMGNIMPTPESRSETASPVHGEILSLPSLYSDVNIKDAKLSSRKKRQNLPRQTTLILLSWLSEHLDRPYPNSREKYELLMKTRLTIQQLDNWFINARRRKINELKKLKENDQSIALMI